MPFINPCPAIHDIPCPTPMSAACATASRTAPDIDCCVPPPATDVPIHPALAPNPPPIPPMGTESEPVEIEAETPHPVTLTPTPMEKAAEPRRGASLCVTLV